MSTNVARASRVTCTRLASLRRNTPVLFLLFFLENKVK